MAESVLLGPFLTRRQAAQMAGVDAVSLVTRRDVLRIGGRSLEEVYFAFQFGPSGVRSDVCSIVASLTTDWDHLTIAHWLSRGNNKLDGLSPLVWLDGGRDVSQVLRAAEADVAIKVVEPSKVGSRGAAA